jgi:glucokinase
MRTFAIDIGGTKFSVAGFEDERLIWRETAVTDRERGPDWMCLQIERMLASRQFRPDRCGIGFGGPVDFPTQTVTLSTHVGGWACYPLVDRIERMSGALVVMDNDANTGALGEAFYGAGLGADPLFYLTLSTGIGGGIIIDRHVYRGADSYAGEIGHLNVEPDGPDCLCGSRGCLERMCCGLWLERDYGKPAEELLKDPQFAEKLGRQMTAWSRARRDVVPAALGDDSVLWGALALARM